MSPEKDIVNVWLHKKGFFTIRDLNAGHRIIDFIAIKKGATDKIQHVEVACSISPSSVSEKDTAEFAKKFDDLNVLNTISLKLKILLGQDMGYEKMLVTTYPGIKLEGIKVINFKHVLLEVMKELDTQDYDNDVLRTMQLLKYLLVASPQNLASLLESEDEHKVLKQTTRQSFLTQLLSQEVSKKTLSKATSEQLLAELLKTSTLKQPEKLAELLGNMLSKRSRNKFFELFSNYIDKQDIEEAIVSNQPLNKFLENDKARSSREL